MQVALTLRVCVGFCVCFGVCVFTKLDQKKVGKVEKKGRKAKKFLLPFNIYFIVNSTIIVHMQRSTFQLNTGAFTSFYMAFLCNMMEAYTEIMKGCILAHKYAQLWWSVKST